MKNTAIIILITSTILLGLSNWILLDELSTCESDLNFSEKVLEKCKCKNDTVVVRYNDYAKINLHLRQIVSEYGYLERKLLKDTAYINLSSKYN